MTSNKQTINTINPFENVSGDTTVNPNKSRDIIISAIELSKDSKVPILFMSNPGYGKTTIVYQYAKKTGRHVEVVSGSQYSHDEILGMQVNEPGERALIVKEPEWYSRIIENEANGIPSILFLDEMSAAEPYTQAALLHVCFERKIRGGKALPEDTLIVAAANYKNNLPGYFEIIAPTLNRFCIINCLPDNAFDMISEFTQGTDANDKNWPEFQSNDLSEKVVNTITSDVKQVFKGLFNTYSVGSSKGVLDIRNTHYDTMADRDDSDPQVYNFISGRSLSYLIRVLISLARLGIKSTNAIFPKVVDGLIGLGTNTWGETPDEVLARLTKYRADVTSRLGRILDKAITNMSKSEVSSTSNLNTLNGKNTISNKITAFIANESADKYETEEFADLTMEIITTYRIQDMASAAVKIAGDSSAVLDFRSDMDNLEILITEMEEVPDQNMGLKQYIIEFTKVIKAYRFYYNASLTLDFAA